MKEQLKRAKFFYDQYKIFIYPVLVTVASLFLIFFLILPQIKGFLGGRENLGQVRNRLEVLTVKAKELETIDKEDLRKKMGLTLTALPSEKDFPQVIGVLQEVARASGVVLLSIQIGQAQSASTTNGFPVKVEVVGSKLALASFLRNVESSSRVMKAGSIELSFSKVQDNIDASVMVDVFYAPTPTALGVVTDNLPKITPEDEKIIVSLSRAPASTSSAIPANVSLGKSNPFE